MMNNSRRIAELLLQSKAIKLEPATPFTWASGWKSPIYCDNRKTLSYPGIRSEIRDAFTELIRQKYPDAGCIAGVATGAIAQGALVAEALNLPFVYVRSSAKKHGLENLIEGVVPRGAKTVVIEDLVSTGGSSLRAATALRKAGCTILGMVAIFSYGFPETHARFEQENVPLDTLSNYHALLETALEQQQIKEEDLNILQQWRKDPANWKGVTHEN